VAADLTVSQLVGAFDQYRPQEAATTRLRKWCDALGDLSAWAVKTENLQTCADEMERAGYAPASINRDVAALGSCYRWAKSRRLAPRGFVSPTLAVQRKAEPIRRVIVTAEQVARIKVASHAHRDRRFALYIHMLADSGARKGELLQPWSALDIARGELLVPRTKTGMARVLHFKPDTMKLAKALQPPANLRHGLIFAGRTGGPINYRKAWQALTRALGMEGLHLHDLRHAAAQQLLRAGVPIEIASQVLGHSSAILRTRYGHLDAATLRGAVEQAWGTSS
jgi:integrase